MVGATGNILSPVLQKQLIAVKRTARVIDTVQLQLATGKLVNSALDNPQNFFTALSLNNRAADLTRLLDGIGQSVRTIQEALTGIKALERLVDQAEAVALNTLEEIRSGVAYPELTNVTTTGEVNIPTPLFEQIQNANPVAYWRFNDAAAPAANQGSGGPGLLAILQNGPTLGNAPLYNNQGDTSIAFDGVSSQRVRVLDTPLINTAAYAERTVELVFNANDIISRQILYEEGSGSNGLAIYIDNGLFRVTGEDQLGPDIWLDADISAPIVAGETYHAAFVFNQNTNSFTGYLDGENIGSVGVANSIFPAHNGNIGIGGMNDGAQFHDGSSSGNNGFNFNGGISDVAVYNEALSAATILSHATSLDIPDDPEFYNTEFENILEQIDFLVEDAQYRGINLLENDNLTTYFNENRSSSLKTKGTDFTADGLGIKRFDFNDENDVNDILESLRNARGRIRTFGRTLASDLNIIKTRETFTRNTINHLKSGGDDLTIADQNEVGAELLALQTRQSIQFAGLSISTKFSIADLL